MDEKIIYRGGTLTLSRSEDYVDVEGPGFEFEVKIYNNENNLVAKLPNSSSGYNKELAKGALQRYFNQHIIFEEEEI